MDNFFFELGEYLNKYSYYKTCEVAKRFNVKPIENITKLEQKIMQNIISRCLMSYNSTGDSLDLIGVFLYEESEQTGEVKDFNGINISISKTKAIIGMSTNLLTAPAMYQYSVFLHELCHLSERGHNENFVKRFNVVLYNFFDMNR